MDTQACFTGKTVVITGSAGGLGLEMGRRFAGASARVILSDVDTEKGIQAAGGLRAEGVQVDFEALDVRVPEQSVELVNRLVEIYGAIDVWVNNAGVAHKGPAETLPVDQWGETIDVMLSGAFYCSQAVSGPMLARGTGVIVNIASVIGCKPIEGRVAYGTAKAGIAALTIIQAAEMGRYGITANAIAPAARTRMTETVFADIDEDVDPILDARAEPGPIYGDRVRAHPALAVGDHGNLTPEHVVD